MKVTNVERFTWHMRGLPVHGARAEWHSGPTAWKGTYDLEPLEPDTKYGDRFVMPARIRFRFVGDQPAPTIEAQIRVRNGWPELESLEVRAEGVGGVRTADLRNIHVDALIEQVAEHASMRVSELGNDTFEWHDSNGTAGRAVRNSKRRGRPRVNDEKVRRAAAVYREHLPGGRPIVAVADALGCSERTAARYIERARSDEYQLLPPTSPGKPKA